MVWPKRKIQLVASSEASGIEGVRALLEGIRLEFSEADLTREEPRNGFTEDWLEKPFSGTCDELSPVTELVVWPEVTEQDLWRKKALSQGLPQQSVQSLIHNILDDELILQVSEPAVFVEGCPLLGHVLNQAGFEPTILWPMEDGKWHCERKQGLHWILPESWLGGLMEDSPIGRRSTGRFEEKATWVVRETGVDFYRMQEREKFIGHLPRWPEPLEEQAACLTIAQCLDLGVSWLDIRLAVSSVWKGAITDDLRWNSDDSGWNARAGGEKLPVTPIDHVEDWWTR